MPRRHQHRSSKPPRTVPYTGSVAVKASKRVEGADGNVTDIHTCACGATKRINRNQTFVERGPWVEPENPVWEVD